MPTPANLVHEASTTTGTGNFTVSELNGKVRFSDSTYGFGTGGSDVFWYFISNQDAAEWEIGTGSMSDANTLVRDTVIASSNSDALVSFSAGTKDVTNDIIASIQVRLDGNQTFTSPITLPNTGLHLLDTGGNHDYIIAPGEDATADRTLTLDLNDADRTLDITGDTTLAGGTHSGTNTGDETASSIRSLGFFDTTNDGTGSGLDADLLDGKHESAVGAGKQTIWIPAYGLKPDSSNGPAPGTVEVASGFIADTLDFDSSADEICYFGIGLPESFSATTTTLTFQALWSTSATDADGVAIALELRAIQDGNTFNGSFGTAVIITDDNNSVADQLRITAESSAVTAFLTAGAGKYLMGKLYRDVSNANDDMTEDMQLVGIWLYYTTDANTDD